MNLSIKVSNTTITDAMRGIIEDKVDHFAKFLHEEDKVRVELWVDKRDIDGQHYKVAIDIQPHGYYAECKANDFYEALDLAIPKIKEQLVKKKDKIIRKKRKAARELKGK